MINTELSQCSSKHVNICLLWERTNLVLFPPGAAFPSTATPRRSREPSLPAPYCVRSRLLAERRVHVARRPATLGRGTHHRRTTQGPSGRARTTDPDRPAAAQAGDQGRTPHTAGPRRSGSGGGGGGGPVGDRSRRYRNRRDTDGDTRRTVSRATLGGEHGTCRCRPDRHSRPPHRENGRRRGPQRCTGNWSQRADVGQVRRDAERGLSRQEATDMLQDNSEISHEGCVVTWS